MKNLIKVGVKYCGGCNPRHDRGSFAVKLSNRFKGIIDFENVIEGKKYDALLVISGCTSNCADYDSYDIGKGVIFVTEATNFDSIVDKFNEILK